MSRFRFFEPFNDAETCDYLQSGARVDALWKAFSQVRAQPETHWLKDLRALVHHIDPGLGLEVRYEPNGSRALSVLPLGGAHLKPLADWCVERGSARALWPLDSGRPPLELPAALRLVLKDFKLDLGKTRARVGVGRGHLLSVVLASHLFTGPGDELGQRAASALVQWLLGDLLFERWVLDVSVVSAPKPSPLRVVGANEAALPLSLQELPDALEAARLGIQAALPAEPLHLFCEYADWVLFELDEPSDACLFPDLLTHTTMCPEMLKCYLSGDPFASERFSSQGERFCMLKLALTGDLEQRTTERQHLEEFLNRSLVPGQLGCVVGAGLGRDYAYLTLALSDVDSALQVLRRRLREQQAPKSSWVLFMDSEWRNEWFGIWEQTPPPELADAGDRT
ncbi:MAG: hypothetical protein RJA70_84 [Pseudomonadota bacterium]